MTTTARATALIRFTVPPGESMVGFMPFTMFRVDRVKTAVDSMLSVGTPRGQYAPFDGTVLDVRSDSGRTLCLGNFLAFIVKNESEFPRASELALSGVAVDWPPDTLIEGKTVLGAFAQEVEKDPEPAFDPTDPSMGIGMDVDHLLVDLEARDPASLAVLLERAGLTREGLAAAMKTPEGLQRVSRLILQLPAHPAD